MAHELMAQELMVKESPNINRWTMNNSCFIFT